MKFLKLGKRPLFYSHHFLPQTFSRFRSMSFVLVALLLVTPLIVFVVKVAGQSGSSPLLISEFRLRGPNGANDEFR